MLVVRSSRVYVVPVVSVVVALLLGAGVVHGIVVAGDPAGPLLVRVGLPAAAFLAYAVFALRRVEHRSGRIRWGRVWLRHAHEVARCTLRGQAHQGGRGHHLTVELVAHDGEPLLDIITVNDDGTADAQAQRIADALGLRYARERGNQPAS
jgi:hypothetical protein